MVRSLISVAALTVLTLGLAHQISALDTDPSDEYMGSFVNEACPAPVTEQEQMIEEEIAPSVRPPVMMDEEVPGMMQKPMTGSREMMPQDSMEKPAQMMPNPSALTPGDEGREEASEDLSLAS